MSRFQLIVFDLDGTLVDSRRDLAESINQLIVERGGGAVPEDTVGSMVGDGAAVLVQRACAAAGLSDGPDALASFLEIYQTRLLNHTRPYDGIVDTLTELHKAAILAVLTNKPLAQTRELLGGLDLDRFFAPQRVCGGDGPLPRKPDPAGLTRLATEAGVAADRSLLVGDSHVDWRTARAAGTAICVVRWGFGFEGFPTGELTSTDYLIDQPGDLLQIAQME